MRNIHRFPSDSATVYLCAFSALYAQLLGPFFCLKTINFLFSFSFPQCLMSGSMLTLGNETTIECPRPQNDVSPPNSNFKSLCFLCGSDHLDISNLFFAYSFPPLFCICFVEDPFKDKPSGTKVVLMMLRHGRPTDTSVYFPPTKVRSRSHQSHQEYSQLF